MYVLVRRLVSCLLVVYYQYVTDPGGLVGNKAICVVCFVAFRAFLASILAMFKEIERARASSRACGCVHNSKLKSTTGHGRMFTTTDC